MSQAKVIMSLFIRSLIHTQRLAHFRFRASHTSRVMNGQKLEAEPSHELKKSQIAKERQQIGIKWIAFGAALQVCARLARFLIQICN